MAENIILGIYLNISSFFASFVFTSRLTHNQLNFIEKLSYSFIFHMFSITFAILFLNFFSQGITPVNAIIFSQTYLLISLIFSLKLNKSLIPSLLLILKKIDKVTLLLIVIFIFDIFLNVYSIYVFVPNETDSLAYHLQAPPNWYQAKNLLSFPSNEYRTTLFSDYSNFTTLWLFITFQSDVFIELGPYVYIVIGTLALFSLLQKINNNPNRNLAFSLLFYYGDNSLNASRNFMGDIQIASLIIISLSLFYSYFQQRKMIHLFFFSLSAGLLLGAKSSGILCVFLIYLLALYNEIFRKNRLRIIKLAYLYAYSLLICFVTGGFYYIRNVFYFHNPFYGKAFNFLNLYSFPGMDPQIYTTSGIKPVESIMFLLRNMFQGLSGLQFLLFFIPASVIIALYHRKSVNKLEASLILLPIVYCVSFFILLTSSGLQSDWRYFLIMSFSGIIILSILSKCKEKQITKFLYVFIVPFLLFSSIQETVRIRLSRPFSEKSLVSLPYYDGDYYFFFRNIPQENNISYLLPENVFIYPFYGSKYENKLSYVNSYNTEEIIKNLKRNDSEYFLARKPGSDFSFKYFHTDFKKGAIELFTEKEATEAVSVLVQKKIITHIGSGSRIDFYKINKENYD